MIHSLDLSLLYSMHTFGKSITLTWKITASKAIESLNLSSAVRKVVGKGVSTAIPKGSADPLRLIW